ncbi:putative hydrolase of the HAD superfamily [Mucilaginibacter gracilis]|uniref:Putative hydrolase of the HAD superfamily n=1 Tax=Mucilaginibacter gracilis TaxID=423350 RepID=A0A495J500_9SPHI|nr:HAD family hydrolase [Mucilaginibacter gracilis]RKR83791.1 putative hydrolase of the HAD superfamily [Mucilaginibacter gracilis]
MQYYQHYSFDLWLTLIKSNSGFKTERTKIFHRDFNPANKSIADVALAFRQVDLMCNTINERTGKNIDADEMYLMVISMINDNQFNLHDIDTGKLFDDMERLLFNYMPIVYSAETNEVLLHLKQNSGATMSLLSNTGFIKGVTLRKILAELGMNEYFNFQLYSDEVGLSKPNAALFNLMLKNITLLYNHVDIDLKNIIHIGDNPKADIEGANAVGIKSLLINSNNKSITSLINPC